jgi:hypothetical protein
MFDVQFIHWSNSAKAASSKAINFMLCCTQASLYHAFPPTNPGAAFHDRLAMLLWIKYLYMLRAQTPI